MLFSLLRYVALLMTALSPGTSPPPVSIPIRFTAMTCPSMASLSILIGAPDEPRLTNSFVRWE